MRGPDTTAGDLLAIARGERDRGDSEAADRAFVEAGALYAGTAERAAACGCHADAARALAGAATCAAERHAVSEAGRLFAVAISHALRVADDSERVRLCVEISTAAVRAGAG